MPKCPLGKLLTPGELWASEETSKEARVERVEDFFQVVEAALGAEEALAAAGVADDLGLAGDCGR